MKHLSRFGFLFLTVILLISTIVMPAVAKEVTPNYDYLIEAFNDKDDKVVIKLAVGDEFEFDSFWGNHGGFYSSDEDVAEVDAGGTVKALKTGEAYIVAISSTNANVDMIKIEACSSYGKGKNFDLANPNLPSPGYDWSMATSVDVDASKTVKKGSKNDNDSLLGGFGSAFSGLGGGGILSVIVPIFIGAVFVLVIGSYIYNYFKYKTSKKSSAKKQEDTRELDIALARVETEATEETVLGLAFVLEKIAKDRKNSRVYINAATMRNLYRGKVHDAAEIKDATKLRLRRAMASLGVRDIEPPAKTEASVKRQIKAKYTERYKVVRAQLDAFNTEENAANYLAFIKEVRDAGEISVFDIASEIALRNIYKNDVACSDDVTEETKTEFKKVLASLGIGQLNVSVPDKEAELARERKAQLNEKYKIVKAQLDAFPNEENAVKFLEYLRELRESGTQTVDYWRGDALSRFYLEKINNNADIKESTRLEIKKMLAAFGVAGLGTDAIRRVSKDNRSYTGTRSTDREKKGSYGKAGEENVWTKIHAAAETGKCNAFFSVALPYTSNTEIRSSSQEVDQIVVSSKGVFLIEVKSNTHTNEEHKSDYSKAVTYDLVKEKNPNLSLQLGVHKNAFLKYLQIDESKVRNILVMSCPYAKERDYKVDISTFPRDEELYTLTVTEVYDYFSNLNGPDVLNDEAVDIISRKLTDCVYEKDGEVRTKWIIAKRDGDPSDKKNIPQAPAKRFCPKCGAENAEAAKFCRNCGSDIGK